MAGFGFGQARRARQRRGSEGGGAANTGAIRYGALSRSTPSAGIAVGASSISSGDAGGHWQISNGRLYPSAAGVAAQLNAGPYSLTFNDASVMTIIIEADTWDVATQAEWDFVANQSAATLAGKTIALRSSAALALGITGASGTPFRIGVFEDGQGNPCTVKGRFGAVGDWGNYCEVDKVAGMRGAVGVRFEHLRFTPAIETKINIISVAAQESYNITLHDLWISGTPADPNGDYSALDSYPLLGVDLITTAGKAAEQGSITVTNCLLEWCDTIAAIEVDKADSAFTFNDNEARYFYGDGVQAVAGVTPQPFTALRNFIHSSVGRADDTNSSHADIIRVQGRTNATADFPIDIRDNVLIKGNARGDAQGIFADDMMSGGNDSGHFFTGTISGNIIINQETTHGITVGQAKNVLIENNTIASWAASNTATPSIAIGNTETSNVTDGGGNQVRNNITDRLFIGATPASNNFVAGEAGATIPYTTLFEGTGYAPTSVDEARAIFLPKVAAGAIFGTQNNYPAAILTATINGAAKDGETITVDAQASGIPAPTVSYQWKKDGVNIAGQTSASLTIDQSGMGLLGGEQISCLVTATNAGGTVTQEPSVGYVGVPTEYLVQGATAGYFMDTAVIPSGTSVIEFRAKLFYPTGTLINGRKPFAILSTQADLENLNDGVRLTVEDSSFAKIISSVVTALGSFSEEEWLDVRYRVDLTTSGAVVTVNGTDYSVPYSQASTGAFQTNQQVTIGAVEGGSAAVAQGVRFADVEVWFNNALHKSISNDPAIANADAWHQGGAFGGAV